MLTPTPMRFVTISLLREDVTSTALALAKFAGFAPQAQQDSNELLDETLGEEYIKLFNSAHGRLLKIMQHLQLSPQVDDKTTYQVLPQSDLAMLN